MKTLYILILSFFFIGCSSLNKNITKVVDQEPQIIEDIQSSKNHKNYTNINIKYFFRDNELFGYINKSNEFKFFCRNLKECAYYDNDKHGFEGVLTPKEEVIFINTKSYSPSFDPYGIRRMAYDKFVTADNSIQCGTGSMYGYLLIFIPKDMENHSKDNMYVCNSRFSKVSSYQIGLRIASGIYTLGTSLLTAGNMHTKTFDEDEFKNAIVESNIESYKTKLLNSVKKYDVKNGIDIVYLNKNDLIDSIDDHIDEIKESQLKISGVLFLEKLTNKFLALTIFDKYKKQNLTKAISLHIDDIVKQINSNYNPVFSPKEFEKFIPSPIEKPKIPKQKSLKKSEYEKQTEFQERVDKAIYEREMLIRKLQREYALSIAKRNEFIKYLENSYKWYVQDYQNSKNIWNENIISSSKHLSKLLLTQKFLGFSAKDMRYDAESERLYFTVFSKDKEFSQPSYSVMPPNSAKEIKENNSFKIVPKVSIEKNAIVFLGFDIYELKSDDDYEVINTNINFKPEKLSVNIITKKENIDRVDSKSFQKYIQTDTKIKDDNTKEYWYVNRVKTINAKVPSWFVNPEISQNTRGYGEGNTLEEAKLEAKKDLAYSINVNIKTSLEKQRVIQEFSNHQILKENSKQISDVELNSSNYRVLKQEQSDGRWFVLLEYIK